jgi:hypothetical protein
VKMQLAVGSKHEELPFEQFSTEPHDYTGRLHIEADMYWDTFAVIRKFELRD